MLAVESMTGLPAGHGGTRTPRNPGTAEPGHCGTRTPWNPDTAEPGHRGTRTPWNPDRGTRTLRNPARIQEGPGAAWRLHVRGPAAVNCIASRGDPHWALQRKMVPSACMNRCLGNRPPSMSWLAWLALALLPARGSLARLALALRPGGACLILPGPLGLASARPGLARPGGPVAQLPPGGKPQDANAMANSIILKKLYDFLTNSLKLLSLPLRLRPGVCLLAEAGPPGRARPGRAG